MDIYSITTAEGHVARLKRRMAKIAVLPEGTQAGSLARFDDIV
jgi:hypothetical protein